MVLQQFLLHPNTQRLNVLNTHTSICRTQNTSICWTQNTSICQTQNTSRCRTLNTSICRTHKTRQYSEHTMPQLLEQGMGKNTGSDIWALGILNKCVNSNKWHHGIKYLTAVIECNYTKMQQHNADDQNYLESKTENLSVLNLEKVLSALSRLCLFYVEWCFRL